MDNKENMGRLISIIYRHTRMYYNHELSKLGLGSGDHIFIHKLSEKDGITQNEITGLLHFDKAHTARTIVRLIEQGYVRREQAKNDKRAYRLSLTKEGRKLLPQIRKIMNSWTSTLLSDFSEGEREKLFEMLIKISDSAVASAKHCPNNNK